MGKGDLMRKVTLLALILAIGCAKKPAPVYQDAQEPTAPTVQDFEIEAPKNSKVLPLSRGDITGQTVLFAFDSDVMTGDLPASIIDRAAWVRIDGHACHIGSDAYNMELSRRRAQAVNDYLTAQGFPANRITVKWYGETKPAKGDVSLSRRAEVSWIAK